MSKIATYLRGHITGEVSTRRDVCEAMSIDMGVLKIRPDMVIYPRTTNDIRKVARFSWQLAEKGHTMPITVRGAGTDPTGAAIGKGVSLNLAAHMNQIYEYDVKQKLVRLQPGATIHALNQALSLHGSAIHSLAGSHTMGTVGGAIGAGVSGVKGGKYGGIIRAIDQLEVVLANGDVLQTKRLSKRELNQKKGLQTFEGDIYRGVETVLEDYADVLQSLRSDDATGYNAIADVKRKDGSMDLAPLFVGSQGTLGIVSEMIMKTEFRSAHYAAATLVYPTAEAARDALDELCKLSPAIIDYFDAELFENAAARGKSYEFYKKAAETAKPESVIIVAFDDFSERVRTKNLKKLQKLVAKSDAIVETATGVEAEVLLSALDVAYYTILPDQVDRAAPQLFEGFQVPGEQFESFCKGVDELSKSLHIKLPLAGHAYTGIYGVYPTFELRKVGDKQKIFKLLDSLTKLVVAHGGTMIAEGGEGRLKGRFVYGALDERLVQMYAAIKQVFDPRGVLNPGVKTADVDIRKLAEQLRDSHEAGQFARFGL